MSDEEIISLFFARDEQALVYTEAKYGPYCFALANAILPIREDAEETVSDTCLKAWQTIPPKRPSVLRMFLAKITRNLAFSRWRNLTAQKRGSGALPLVLEELEECVGAGEDPGTILEAKELTRTICRLWQVSSPGLHMQRGDTLGCLVPPADPGRIQSQ